MKISKFILCFARKIFCNCPNVIEICNAKVKGNWKIQTLKNWYAFGRRSWKYGRPCGTLARQYETLSCHWWVSTFTGLLPRKNEKLHALSTLARGPADYASMANMARNLTNLFLSWYIWTLFYLRKLYWNKSLFWLYWTEFRNKKIETIFPPIT